MLRSAVIAIAATLLVSTTATFALDSGGGVSAIGPTARISTSMNPSRDTYNASPGFPASSYTGGRGVPVIGKGSTNPTFTASFTAQAQVMPINGGKGYGTQTIVSGRNDPQPILGGKRNTDNYGGVGL